jgi:hypothetical protein
LVSGEEECISVAIARTLPLVVSLTTLPSRIDHLRATIDSLYEQTCPPDKILLCLPKWSQRENAAYDRPNWLSLYHSLLEVVESDDDGPGTKLLGALDHIVTPTCLIVADDDMRYKPSFLEHLYRHQVNEPAASFSYYTYPKGPVTVGQGADGLSFYSPNLSGIHAYAKKAIKFPALWVMDDVWICAFLWRRGVPVKNLGHLVPAGGFIYEATHSVNQLRDMSGDLRREAVTTDGLNYLFEHGLLGRPLQLVALAKKILRTHRSRLFRRAASIGQSEDYLVNTSTGPSPRREVKLAFRGTEQSGQHSQDR